MSEKKAKIVACKFIKEWTGANGVVYYHEIELDNKDKGQIGTKDRLPDKIAEGQELTYTIEETAHGNKIKAVQAQTGFRGGKPQVEPRYQFIGFSYAYAKDCVVAGKCPIGDIHKIANEIFENMKKMYGTVK